MAGANGRFAKSGSSKARGSVSTPALLASFGARARTAQQHFETSRRLDLESRNARNKKSALALRERRDAAMRRAENAKASRARIARVYEKRTGKKLTVFRNRTTGAMSTEVR